MLYLISGTSRSGKTMIAKQISAQKGIPYLSIDWLMMGFTNGIPEYGIHDKLMPDEIAKRLWSFLKAMLESMIYDKTDCIIEGEAILPELVVELLEKYPNEVKVCFIGYTDVNVDEKVNEIKEFSFGKSDWLTGESDEYIIDHVENMISHSRIIKKSCVATDLQFFDTSKNFLKGVENARKYLMA